MFNGSRCLCGVHVNTGVRIIAILLMSFFGLSAGLFAFLFFLESVPSMVAQNTFITSLLFLSFYSLLFAGVWRRNATLYPPAMVALLISVASSALQIIMLFFLQDQDFVRGFSKLFVVEPALYVRWILIGMFLIFCPINIFFFCVVMQGYNWMRNWERRDQARPDHMYEMVSQVAPSTRCTSATQFT